MFPFCTPYLDEPEARAYALNRIRIAAWVNSSSDLIERFIRQNVQSGTTLLATDPYPFLDLLGRGYDLEEVGETLSPCTGPLIGS
jgi:hypothetical protein